MLVFQGVVIPVMERYAANPQLLFAAKFLGQDKSRMDGNGHIEVVLSTAVECMQCG